MPSHPSKSSHLPPDVCEKLCTKTMYMAVEDRDLFEDFPEDHAHTAAFWCVTTQMPYGPDELIADPASCRPGRSCCESRLPQM